MASNRDPQKKYRINRRGRKVKVTSSSDRSKRVKASTAPKPTSSSTRSRGKGTGSKKVTSDKTGRVKRGLFATKGDDYQRKLRNVGKKPAKVTGATPTNVVQRTVNLSSKRASLKPVDSKTERKARTGDPKNNIRKGPVKKKPSTSKVKTPKKSITMGGDTGRRGGTNQPATAKSKVPTQGRPKVSKVGPQIKASGGMKTSSNNLRARGTAALAGALAAGSLRNPVSKAKKREAKKNVGKYNTRDADGTVRSRLKVGPAKVGPKKVGPKKVGTIAQSFDKAFAAAKKAGKKEFTFKGKKYNTKSA